MDIEIRMGSKSTPCPYLYILFPPNGGLKDSHQPSCNLRFAAIDVWSSRRSSAYNKIDDIINTKMSKRLDVVTLGVETSDHHAVAVSPHEGPMMIPSASIRHRHWGTGSFTILPFPPFLSPLYPPSSSSSHSSFPPAPFPFLSLSFRTGSGGITPEKFVNLQIHVGVF
jgi:hypothetical protein